MPLELTIIGGCTHIGVRNCCALRDPSEGIAIMNDCGGAQMMDIEQEPAGFNLNIIDPGELAAVVPSHGHLDHIGGLGELAAYLGPRSKKERIPLLATRFTHGCISHEFVKNDFRPPLSVQLDECFNSEGLSAAPYCKRNFLVSTMHLDHTIPDAVGIMTTWKAPGGRNYRVLNLGDFRIGARWERLVKDGTLFRPDVLLLDSSGALSPGTTPPEEVGIQEIIKILERHPDQDVVIAGFSTNVKRWGEVIARLPHERHVKIEGFSMKRKLDLAARMRLMDKISRQTQPKGVPSLTFMTGAQAEYSSALWKYVYGSVNDAVESFDPSSVIVLSARVIPGNEEAVGNMLSHAKSQMNDKGRVYASMNSPQDIGAHELLEVSPSGHCCADDLARVIREIQPRLVVAVHGDRRSREENVAIATSEPGVEAIMVEDGETIDLVA